MAKINTHLAKHFRDLHYGGNWTSVNLKDTLADVTWEESTQKVFGCNSILELTYHIHYYVHAVLGVLHGNPLDAHDKYSFEHPEIRDQNDWENFREKCWDEANEFANMMANLPDDKLWEYMADEKYGNYFRNLLGIIEHSHYHLGQINVLKKIIRAQ